MWTALQTHSQDGVEVIQKELEVTELVQLEKMSHSQAPGMYRFEMRGVETRGGLRGTIPLESQLYPLVSRLSHSVLCSNSLF